MVIGAGFAGIYALKALRDAGRIPGPAGSLPVRVYSAAWHSGEVVKHVLTMPD